MSDVNESILEEIYAVVLDRARHPVPGSYTNYLLGRGLDKIVKKFGEQAVQVIVAAKNGHTSDIVGESADLIYHLIVLFAVTGIPLEDLLAELRRRRTQTESY
ncbi:MAG: phosphoribosyl-ATP diphosphatase [Clostridiaceae bacterium]|nr:phosphoribosyl-ATP diphosphatase [Clostridiaceae bacterium]